MRKNNKKLTYLATIHQASIWPLCLLAAMLKYRLYEMTGENNGGEIIGVWENRVNKWAGDLALWDTKVAERMLIKTQNQPKRVWRIAKIIPNVSDRLNKYTQEIFNSDLRGKTDKEILNLYLDFNQKYTDTYIYFWLPNSLEGKLNLFTAKLEEDLGLKLEQEKKAERLGGYLSVLTTPPKLSNREKERLGFLKIISLILRKRGLKDIFLEKNLRRIKSKLAATFPEIYRLISDHHQKYCWLPFDYDGPAWSLEYFFNQAREIMASGVEPATEIRKLKNSKQEIRKLQKQYARELNLAKDKKLSYHLALARELMFLKDYRKDALFKSYYHMDKLIREIGRRLSLTAIQVKHILPQEMEDVLVKRKYSAAEINQRIKYSVLLYKDSKKGFIPRKPIKIYTGKIAREIAAKKISQETLDTDIKMLIGQTAYPGQAKGKVKLIFSVNDLKKMKTGEILVSPSTNPNLLPAMKKAAAIITDMGGITSHAAIISRELKIPCVVGTRIATKVLKDGITVEVDASQGIIKILKY